ncbi:GDP-mannose 4,6-dehydratase [Verrucomicrobia bacterium]|nr:GDP-mannose 4,6-dehydratase [Verrucomicrobiota bacterium]MDB4664812.1 GDP-mannose 4,6-dehydratase [Verrucomicrobiota bacterium]MDC0268096.1 GDP-mannose 4,6-dehydratase [bacterium]MDG1891751.1 GDP-mannose 4,6-dehydratase [Verrucomicrobiota bacterium]
MKYLITGGAGFIGSHLAEALLAQDHTVITLDDFSTGTHQNVQIFESHPEHSLVVGDVRDEALIQELVSKVDGVFHLASSVGVKLIIEQPIKTIENIVIGASRILSACARYRKPVLMTSTSEAYGKSKQLPFAEDQDLLIGPTHMKRWAYASAKVVDEFLSFAYWHEQGLPIVNVRLFNTVGPRQTGQYGMVVPTLIRQALANKPLTVFGDGSQTRCFCHVKDVISALIRLLECPQTKGQLFNVGNDQETSIGQLAKSIIAMTDSSSEIQLVPYHEAYGEGFEDMQQRVPNLQKIKAAIAYEPCHDLSNILSDIIAFERDHSLYQK